MDKADLMKALKEHKESCFHKRSCEICSIETYDDTQCDYCGKLTHRYGRCFDYRCRCELRSYLSICYDCNKNVVHYNIIEQPSEENHNTGIYINDCCPMTKAAN